MKLAIYKRSQGTYTRLSTAFALILVFALGCVQLYKHLKVIDTSFSPNVEMWIQALIPVILFVLLSLLGLWLVNRHKIADFMIDAEGEMKKVSWSSRHEIFVSTVVVITVVVLMAALLGAFDLIFSLFFTEIIGI